MKAHIGCLIAASLLAITAAAGADSLATHGNRLPVQFPLVDHPVYEFLERLETTGEIPLQSDTRPALGRKRHPAVVIPRSADRPSRELSRYLEEGFANYRLVTGRTEPSEQAWARLKSLAGLRGRAWSWLYRDGFHLASWGLDTVLTVAVQPVYGYERIDLGDDSSTIGRFAGGLRVEGGYAGRLHYLVDFRDYTESGNGPYSDRSRLHEDLWGYVDLDPTASTTSYDISESFLQYYGRDLSVAAGRGRHQWGPGRAGSLFLSSRMPPFDYVRFDAAVEAAHSARAMYYTFLHGWLESQVVADTLYVTPAGRPRTLNAQKYFSAQRLEVRPRDNLLLALSQGVIYGDRGLQLGYLTPLNFLYSVQHANDDKDNMVLSLDGTWRLRRGVKLYGELFLDDLVVSELLGESGNNKSAYTVGSEFGMQAGANTSLDLWLEFTRIRPFVYTHVFAANRYSHWTSPIGYSRRPNSEVVSAEGRVTVYPVQLALLWSRERHGANLPERNVGGDILVPLPDSEKDRDYPLLDGQLERTTRLGARLSWQPLPNLILFGQAAAVETDAENGRTEWQAGFAWNL